MHTCDGCCCCSREHACLREDYVQRELARMNKARLDGIKAFFARLMFWRKKK